jgi:hypothetical protein
MFVRLIGWMMVSARSPASKDAELPVLRQQDAVLHRSAGRPDPSWPPWPVLAE